MKHFNKWHLALMFLALQSCGPSVKSALTKHDKFIANKCYGITYNPKGEAIRAYLNETKTCLDILNQ